MSRDNSNLVSVIIPIHNRFELVQQTITSVVNQTYRPLELIIVDDASDQTFQSDIFANHQVGDINWNLLRSEKNIGPGAAREMGRKTASGDFICYLDSDDLWQTNKVEAQVKALLDSPNAGMCYCITKEFSSWPLTGNETIRKSSDQAFSTFLPDILFGRPWCTSSCMWRRAAMDEIGPWFPGWIWEDYEYDSRAGCHDIQIVFIPDVLCFYRKGCPEGQLSAQDLKKRKTQQALSLILIAQNLERFAKLGDKTIHWRTTALLFNLGLLLVANEETQIADRCFAQALHLNPRNIGLALAIRTITLSSRILPPRRAAAIGYRLRPCVIKGN